tara:strand:+ start:54 stop:650 length:597 start_codon:yes stop_codon:yes gene_type:complete
MNQLLIEWSTFCKDNTVFEDSHFYTLFMEGITSEEIKEVYKYFPNSERLIERMERFLFESKPDIEDFELKKIELEKLIKLDFEERKPILEKIDLFTSFNSHPKFIFTSDFESISTLILDDVWSQSFHDFMRMQKLITDKKVYELNNALYGITYDFDYQLFLFEPLLKTNYSVKYLFEFKRLGGVYAITANGVYYSFKK